MTTGITAAVANGWLDSDFSTVHVQLHTGDPGAAGTTAPAAGDTTRKNPTMASASAAAKAMTGTAGPWTDGGTTETLSHISLWSAGTGGTFKGSTALTASQAWVSGNTFTLTTLSISITPIAA